MKKQIWIGFYIFFDIECQGYYLQILKGSLANESTREPWESPAALVHIDED